MYFWAVGRETPARSAISPTDVWGSSERIESSSFSIASDSI